MIADAVGAVVLLIFLLLIVVLVVIGVLWVGAAAVTVISGGAMLKAIFDSAREDVRSEEWEAIEGVFERHGAEIERREGKAITAVIDPDVREAIIEELDGLGYDAKMRVEDD